MTIGNKEGDATSFPTAMRQITTFLSLFHTQFCASMVQDTQPKTSKSISTIEKI